MEEKCFCHFNGYQVKDAVARAAAGEKAKFYFPSFEGSERYGSSAIAVFGKKCVLLDCGPEENCEPIKAYYTQLYNSGAITNIDYIVISHYHSDHIENLNEILQAIPHEGCKAYLPLNPEGYFTQSTISQIAEFRSTVINTLADNGVEYIEVFTDTTVNISEACSMELFNSSPADYTNYAALDADYNNYSMCALFNHGDLFTMFPGDLEAAAQQRIIGRRELPRLFLYAVHHHGTQNDDVAEYLEMIRPEHGVISTSHTHMFSAANDCMAGNYAVENLYSLAYGECEFSAQNSSGSVQHGRKLVQAGIDQNNFTLYVNNEYTGTKHTGTEAAPFTSIDEALIFINQNRATVFTVKVKATGTEYERIKLYNFNKHIVIEGYSEDGEAKPKVKSVWIYASFGVEIKNFFVTGDVTKNVVYAGFSNVLISDCEITSTTGNSSANQINAVFANKHAQIYIMNSTIRGCYSGITGDRYAKISTENISFSNVRRCYHEGDADLAICGNDTITDDVTAYIQGSSVFGTQITFANQTEGSNIRNLVAKNSTTAQTHPFYWQNVGCCIVVGQSVYKLTMEAIA